MDGLIHSASSLMLSAKKSIKDRDWSRFLNVALIRIFVFLFVALPLVFESMMYSGGFMMSYLSGWPFQRGFNFMASAMTGGAIVFPAKHPDTFASKCFASAAASFGIGIFGFTVAALKSSLVKPLVQVFGIGIQEHEIHSTSQSTSKILGRLALIAKFFLVANVCTAAVNGCFLSYMQGWDFWTGFKTMASVILGGGIQFDGMGTVTKGGRLLYTTVGVWSISISTLMVAIAGDPGSKLVRRATGIAVEEGSRWQQALSMLAYLVFLILPVTLLLIMLGVASIMGPLTTWDFEGAFWAALPAVSGGAAALSSTKNPALTTGGAVILICAASAGFFFLSLMIAVGGELVGPIVEGPLLGPFLGTRRTIGHSLVALCSISLILIPSLVFVGSVFVGGFMAFFLDWPFSEGFWWTVSVQLGGGMSLSNMQVHSYAGMYLATIVVAWSIGMAILAIGVSGAPVVEPLMDALGMSINPEELLGLSSPKGNTYDSGESLNSDREAVDCGFCPCCGSRLAIEGKTIVQSPRQDA